MEKLNHYVNKIIVPLLCISLTFLVYNFSSGTITI